MRTCPGRVASPTVAAYSLVFALGDATQSQDWGSRDTACGLPSAQPGWAVCAGVRSPSEAPGHGGVGVGHAAGVRMGAGAR
eukprot:12153212-Alexandrium_andersonii.AAC.1